MDLEANRHEAIFLFHSSSTTVSTSTAERSYRIRSSYTSKCPVRPVFPCPNLSLRSRCASSRGQFRTVSPLSRFLPSIVLNRDREFPRSGFRSHRMAKNQRRKKKKINKSRATLVLSMVIPKKDDAGQRCGHCPFGRVPFSHTSSTGWIFCLLYGRNWLSPSPPPDHPPSRFIVEKPDFDGWTEARARGSGLEKFFKVGQWRCSANWGRNWRGLENVFSLLQRMKVWEDRGTSLYIGC